MLQPGDTIIVEGGEAVRLDQPLMGGRGGEGAVFDVSAQGLVAKIYHTPPTADLVAKLTCMIANPPEDPERARSHPEIAWPLGLAWHSGKVVGFLMPKAPPGRQLVSLLSPRSRKQWLPGFTWQGMLLAARNLADAFGRIHAKGYVVGDVKPENVHVTEQSLVTILDTDSFQVHDAGKGVIYPCGVATPGYTAPELLQGELRGQPRRPEQDCFALGVIIFKLLSATNAHPYQGVWVGMGDAPDSDDELVLNGWYMFRPGSLMRPNPRVMPLASFPPDVAALLDRCFVQGHISPSARPTAEEWCRTLDRIVNNNSILARCTEVPWHIYHRGVECPWCALTRNQGVSYFPGPLPSPQPLPPPMVAAPKPTSNRRAPIVPPPPPWPPPQPQLKLLPQGGASQPPQVLPAGISALPTSGSLLRLRRMVLAGVAAVALLAAGAALYAALRSPAVAVEARSHMVLSPAAAAKVGDVWMNSIGMRLAYVPAGEFAMGSPAGQGGGEEHPEHRVQLSRPVLMGRTEVTQWQYREIMGKNPSFITGNEDCPVEQVSWDDAMEFCRRLGAREGRSYRLPTEAEWEYACRAGLVEADGGVSRLDQTAWYIANSGSRTRAVAMRQANAWGLYDMHGSVWEWCMDWYGPYGEGEQVDPAGAEEGTARVARGGSWYRDPEQCGAASRISFEPGMRLNEVGFRVVLENPGKRDR